MKEQGGIAPFNLANQSRIIRGRMPLLEIIHDKFSRELTSRLSESLGFRVEVNPISIDWSKFDSFMRSLPVPTAISLMTMEPLNGKFLHVLDARSVCALVEKLLGGDEPQRLEGREFTSLEQHLLEINMLPYIIDILQDSWAMLSHFDIKHEEMVKHPPFACIVEPSEAVIVITFEIEIDNAIGSLTLCYPYRLIYPILGKLRSFCFPDREEVVPLPIYRVFNSIADTRLYLSVRLGSTDIKYRDFQKLKIEDIIQFDQKTKEGMVVSLNKQPRFVCRETQSDSAYRAVTIDKIITNPNRRGVDHV